jgi:hypothetical protein
LTTVLRPRPRLPPVTIATFEVEFWLGISGTPDVLIDQLMRRKPGILNAEVPQFLAYFSKRLAQPG